MVDEWGYLYNSACYWGYEYDREVMYISEHCSGLTWYASRVMCIIEYGDGVT